MSLGNKQRKFSLLISQLIIWIYEQGYEITDGDAFRDPRVFGHQGESKGYGHRNSNHKLKLARDLNLFKDGEYLPKTSDHAFIGKKWESMDVDCVWGGRFNDGNHYSFKHNGFM